MLKRAGRQKFKALQATWGARKTCWKCKKNLNVLQATSYGLTFTVAHREVRLDK